MTDLQPHEVASDLHRLDRSGADLPGAEVRAALLPGAVLAYGVGAAVHRVHADAGHAAGELSPVLHWLRDSSLALPLAVLVVVLAAAGACRAARRLALPPSGAAVLTSLLSAVLYAVAMVPAGRVHALLFPAAGHAHGVGEAGHVHTAAVDGPGAAQMAALDASTALTSGLVLLLVLAGLRQLPGLVATRARRHRRRPALLAVLTATALLSGAAPAAGLATPTDTEPDVRSAVAACGPTTADRTYDVAAIDVHVPYNRWGQGNPEGMVYVLQSDKTAVRDWHRPLGSTGDDRRLRPRPLVLRANEGDCVQVRLTNELADKPRHGLPSDPRVSMAVRGVPYDVQTSAGSHAGYNADTTLGRGQSTTMHWVAPGEGTYFFSDAAMPAGSEADGGGLSQGLYGALVVEPAGSTWRDPRSGRLLYEETGAQSGELYLEAVIDPPTGRTFRESVQLSQDELPHTSTFAFNYGSEPQEERESQKCPDCVGEETSLSSWAYGDPAMVKLASGLGPWKPRSPQAQEDCGLGTKGFDADSCFTSNVTHAYPGDPFKFRYGMAGGRETHVFHLHAHQWLAEDQDVGAAGPTPSTPGPAARPQSQTIDSQTFGPMETFTADLLFGAGSRNRTVGDSIFHCHLYPHFADGFWSLLRVHDVQEDGTLSTPDGVKVAALLPLTDTTAPPAATDELPGYPRFIPGQVGWRAPQPPLGVQDAGRPAVRHVGGRALEGSDDAAVTSRLATERRTMAQLSGGTSKPGAPFGDPCPTGSREVTYKVSAIQTDVVYNERGDHDTQARVLVLDKDVAAVLAGTKKPEPLFARVSAGDCINWQLTNRLPNWFGDDAFQKLTQTNMFGQHIHLVKFDVLASDGASNGWNYQQAAFSRAQAAFNQDAAAGRAACTSAGCRLGLPASYDPRSTSAGLAPGQTILERWYADYELRTVFTHDHHFAAVDQNRGQFGAVVVEPSGMDFRDPRTGAFLQPVSSPGRGLPVCAASCEGAAVGAVVDVIGPGPDDDFRDFGLAIADFVSLTRKGGDPRMREHVINPPLQPEAFPDEDPGVMAINYRNAPLDLRRTKAGAPVDPAYAFSSTVFGDPQTPVLQTYAGDNVRIRLIQGSQEEQHQVLVHGQKWREEPDDPDSPMVDAVPVGVSEAFNFEAPRLNCAVGEDCRGDYLYSGSSVDDIATGAWGILRVNGGRVPGLKPLPDNLPAAAGSVPARSATALAPAPATAPGTPCTAGAPVKKFSVVALQTRLVYNAAGDHDPYGLAYVLAADEATVRRTGVTEPLVLRANEGDCIEVTLTNKLTTALLSHGGPADGDALTPGESTARRAMGLRVSMHPGLLKYDVRGSDGAAVGFNKDSTVGPGRSITYRWYADDVTPGEIGAVNLTDFGDVRGHRHHGLYAGLVVEPRGATWHSPVTGAPVSSGASVDVRRPGTADFREHVVFYADGLNLRTAAGAHVHDPQDHAAAPGAPAALLDPEDQGEKALGYRNEPYRHRLGAEPVSVLAPDGRALADVHSSSRHGDPATPLLRSYAGDPVRVRVLQGADKGRQHAFGVDGHSFRVQADDPGSRRVGVLSGLTVGSATNARIRSGLPGDYLYGSPGGFFARSGGLWGLFRAYPAPQAATELLPTPVARVDDPRAGGHPLLPLEVGTVRADVFSDLDRDGVHDTGEPAVAGAQVSALTAGRTVARARSLADGLAHVPARGGAYEVRVTPPTGFALLRPLPPVTVPGDNGVVRVAVPVRRL